MTRKLCTHRALVRGSVVAAIVAAAFATVLAQPTTAAPPLSGGGTVVEIPAGPPDVKSSGPVVHITGPAIDVFSGTINGVAVMEFHAVVDAQGVAHVRVNGSCFCVVDGKSGIVVLSLSIHDRTAVGGGVTGVLRARGVSGDVEGFHGIFDVNGFTYSGQYHFAGD